MYDDVFYFFTFSLYLVPPGAMRHIVPVLQWHAPPDAGKPTQAHFCPARP
jgi:hypothetical protein